MSVCVHIYYIYSLCYIFKTKQAKGNVFLNCRKSPNFFQYIYWNISGPVQLKPMLFKSQLYDNWFNNFCWWTFSSLEFYKKSCNPYSYTCLLVQCTHISVNYKHKLTVSSMLVDNYTLFQRIVLILSLVLYEHSHCSISLTTFVIVSDFSP